MSYDGLLLAVVPVTSPFCQPFYSQKFLNFLLLFIQIKYSNPLNYRNKETEVSPSPKSRGFRLFQSSSGSGSGQNGQSSGQSNNNGHVTQDTGTGTMSKDAIMSRVGQR